MLVHIKTLFFTFILEGNNTGSGGLGVVSKSVSPESCCSSDSGFSHASPQSNPPPERKMHLFFTSSENSLCFGWNHCQSATRQTRMKFWGERIRPAPGKGFSLSLLFPLLFFFAPPKVTFHHSWCTPSATEPANTARRLWAHLSSPPGPPGASLVSATELLRTGPKHHC